MVFNVMFYGLMAQFIKSNLIASNKNQHDQLSYLCVNKTKKLNNLSINNEKIYEKDTMEDCMDHDEDEEYEEEEEETEKEVLLESNTTTATNSAFQSLSSLLNSPNGEKYMNEQNCLGNTTKSLNSSLLNLDERIFNDWGIEVISVPDISPIAFNIMIDYIYMNFDSRKSVGLNEENVMHTLYAGFNFFRLYKL